MTSKWTRWSGPRRRRTAGGLCIKSTIGDRPFGRSIFVFRKPHRIHDTPGEFRKPGQRIFPVQARIRY